MAKLKQKYMAFRTAELNFNKKKISLKNEFVNEMNEAAKIKDIKRFNTLGAEMIKMLGKNYEFTVVSLEILHGINQTA